MVDYRGDAEFHVGGCVLLPAGARAEFAEWETFHAMAVATETRRNAQEGRILDFALPRAVPRALLLPLAAYVLLPFIELGMAVRLDVECVPASDGEPNPHAHVWLAQRELGQDGFGLKERSWNTFFRRDGGKYVRALVAARLTLGCAILDFDAYVDPRCNDVKGGGKPEPRLPRRAFSDHKEGKSVKEIEQLKASRRLKQAHRASKLVTAPDDASVTVTNAAVYRLSEEEAAERRKRFANAAWEAGYFVESETDELSILPAVSLIGTSISFDGRRFWIAAGGGSDDAAIVARFVRELAWPGLVVEGGLRLTDLLAIATANEGVFMVNRAPSAAARDIISRAFSCEFRAAIARHDPRGIAEAFFAEFEATSGAEMPFDEAPAPAEVVNDVNSASAALTNTETALSDEAAVPASSIAAIGGDNVRAVAADADVRQTTGSAFETADGLDELPGDNSWKIAPDPAGSEKTARCMFRHAEGQRQMRDEQDQSVRRIRERSSGLGATDQPPFDNGFPAPI